MPSPKETMTEVATLKAVAEVDSEEITQEAEEEEASHDIAVDVEVHAEQNAQRVDMSNTSTGHKCLACDKTFKVASDLDRHVQDKHTEHECDMCNIKFTSRKQAQEHI